MSLSPGTRVGPYEVTAQIGAGGMGEVCRARDTKLNRDVALKVLPSAFATDPERMSRFQREAQLLAALNHPNIAAIYGLEDEGSIRAIVMELVDGHTLTGPLPVADALPVAKQIAEALEYAPERNRCSRRASRLHSLCTCTRPHGTANGFCFASRQTTTRSSSSTS